MPMFKCPTGGCQLTLRFGEPGVCLMNNMPLVPYEPTGKLVTNFHTGCAPHHQKSEFKAASFRLERFMPATKRGLFDLSMDGAGGRILVTVKVKASFTMPPSDRDWGPLRRAYADLTPWTLAEQRDWMLEQQGSLDTVWNATHHALLLTHPGGWTRRYSPAMRIRFVENDSDAHIVADVEKAPPTNPDLFNCGGSRLNLAQIITGNPNAVSTAALNSQSGRPVVMETAMLGFKIEETTILYNIVAHEYGHMIGLPDEYNSGGAISGKDIKGDAYAIHCQATNKLALKARQDWVWNSRSDSLMSTGNKVYPRHLITVWEAVTVATDRLTKPWMWSII